MKNYTIDMIQAMTETDAAAIALEKLDVKGHTVQFAGRRIPQIGCHYDG